MENINNETCLILGALQRTRAKALSYAEVALQSSTTTFQQGKNQLKGQDEVTRPAFSQEEASSNVIL